MVSGALGSAVFSAVTGVLLMVIVLPPFHARAHRLGRPLGFLLDQHRLLLIRRPIQFTSFGLVAHSVASFQAASSACRPGRHPIYGPIHGAASVIRLEIPSAKMAPLRGG